MKPNRQRLWGIQASLHKEKLWSKVDCQKEEEIISSIELIRVASVVQRCNKTLHRYQIMGAQLEW